jgi:hypothetical protein
MLRNQGRPSTFGRSPATLPGHLAGRAPRNEGVQRADSREALVSDRGPRQAARARAGGRRETTVRAASVAPCACRRARSRGCRGQHHPTPPRSMRARTSRWPGLQTAGHPPRTRGTDSICWLGYCGVPWRRKWAKPNGAGVRSSPSSVDGSGRLRCRLQRLGFRLQERVGDPVAESQEAGCGQR